MVVDTSAWVEFLRGTGSAVNRRVEALVRERSLLVTDPVLMELLAGARDRDEWLDLQRMLFAFEFERVQSPGDWIDAAALSWRLRGAGRTVPDQADHLIAVVAMRLGVPVLTLDADFVSIAQHSDLQLA
jgi:predicted nucleic acid-binding protein